MLVIANELLC